jgi:CheY-like chemotaxis protein
MAKVVIIEDNAGNLNLAASLLQSVGHTVATPQRPFPARP